MSPKHFLDISDFDATTLNGILAKARAMKDARKGLPKGLRETDEPLKGRMLALIFERPSTRTRVSFEVGMQQMGGETLVLSSNDMQLGRGETIADTARVLSRYVDAIMIRTDDHAKAEELADFATVPVINGLTDLQHPCQILADLLTVRQHLGSFEGKTIAWIGDGNNVANSWCDAALRLGFSLRLACPVGYDPDASILARAQATGRVTLVRDPREAAAGADVVTTDVWASMGQEEEHAVREMAFAGFQVNAALMGAAQRDAIFLHCLPAHRGEEVTADVIDGPQSRVWDEAENRLHVQKAVMAALMGGEPLS